MVRWRLPTAAAFVCIACPSALAHEREYTLSRDWFLPYKGEHEIESRTFINTSHGEWVQEFEYEYGVTDWFAVEPGIEIKEKPDSNDIEIEAVELELRFHFLEFSYDKILPALNVEYEHPSESDEVDSGELKFIFARYGEDGQDFAVNLNFGMELEDEHDGESEITFGYVRPLGGPNKSPEAGWHKEPRIGVEAIHDWDIGSNGLGPLVVYRGTEHLNLLVSYIFALDHVDETGDELRVIAEFEF